MAGLDELSVTIGKLEATTEDLRRLSTSQLKALDSLHLGVMETRKECQTSQALLDLRLSNLEDSHKRLRAYRNGAVMAIIGGLSTIAAAGITVWGPG